ncbi:MAG: hypothetical protein R6V33_03655 [Pelovirga sp.]
MTDTQTHSAADSFVFWTPPAATTLSIYEDEHYTLPEIPLPLRTADVPENVADKPSERSIGEAVYDYLCLHPEAQMAPQYADILRHAYPFLISDIGSRLLLLDLRPHDLKALQDKTALLKILLYLDSDNFGLLHKLGVAYFNLAIHPQTSADISEQLQSARHWFEKARRCSADDANNLNYIGQVCYLTGNYHQARLYWQSALVRMTTQDNQEQLRQRLDLLIQGCVPHEPLQQQLDRLAQARRLLYSGDSEQAHRIVESLVDQGDLLHELPSGELCYFIGICREKANDLAGAYEALMMAISLDDKHEKAHAALKRVAPVT